MIENKEWKEFKLREIADYINKKVDIDFLTKRNYISTENLLPNIGGIIESNKLSTVKKVNSFKEKDILFSNIRTYFKKIWLANTFGGASNDVLIIRSKDSKIVLNEYLYYSLAQNKFFDYTVQTSKGTKMPRGDKEAIMNYTIKVPKDIEEQKKIGAILKSLDDKIELNNKMNETLEEMAQTIFKEWFVNFNFPNEEGKPYKDNGGKMVKSELGMIPEGWRVERLGNLVKIFNGYSYKGKELGKSNDAMLTIKNFDRKGGFKINGYKEISISDKVKSHHYVQLGDIVVAHTDLTQGAEIIGNPIFIQTKGEYENIIISMDTVKVEIVSKFLTKNILYYLLKSSIFKKHALAYVNGTTVLHLDKKAIPEYKLIFTYSSDIVNKLDSILNQFIVRQRLILEENQTLIKTRDILLPKLMSGEIRVK